MSKLSIDGKIIGTDADKVAYVKNNADTVEDALDALFAGGGGSSPGGSGETDNADLAMLADSLLVAGGVQSAPWRMYLYNNSRTISLGGTFNPSSLGSVDSYRHCSFPVHKGDTLHLINCGEAYGYAYVLTDKNNVVVGLPSAKQKFTGTVEVTQDGYCYVISQLHSTDYAVAYAQWNERKTLATKRGILGAIGDSISSDASPSRPICYPRILAKLLNCELDRRSKAGANLGMAFDYTDMDTGYMYMRSDCDYVTILMGANDATMVSSVPVGDADSAMALDLDNDVETLKSTYIGRYRLLMYRLKSMMAKDVKIFCIGPFDMDSDHSSINTTIAEMRTQLSSLVTKMGCSTNGYYYINGNECLPFTQGAFLDHVHPNEVGQVVLANTLYTRMKELMES